MNDALPLSDADNGTIARHRVSLPAQAAGAKAAGTQGQNGVHKGVQPISDGLSGLRIVNVLEAASRSIAEQGRPITLGRQLPPVRTSAKVTA